MFCFTQSSSSSQYYLHPWHTWSGLTYIFPVLSLMAEVWGWKDLGHFFTIWKMSLLFLLFTFSYSSLQNMSNSACLSLPTIFCTSLHSFLYSLLDFNDLKRFVEIQFLHLFFCNTRCCSLQLLPQFIWWVRFTKSLYLLKSVSNFKLISLFELINAKLFQVQ